MSTKLLLVSSSDDRQYLHQLKPMLASATVKIMPLPTVPVIMPIALEAKKYGCTGVIFFSQWILEKLVGFTKEVTVNDYAGSLIDHSGLEWLCMSPPEQTYTKGEGKFLAERYLSKFTYPEKWFPQTEFSWEIVNESTVEAAYNRMAAALWIAIDIETRQDDEYGPVITCVSYTGIYLVDSQWLTHSVVVPFTSEFFVVWCGRFNNLRQAKILQGGSYDHAYFFRFGIPCYNWKFDTLSLFHSWYSELPKRLDFLATFVLRKVQFWKDEGKTGSLEDYYRYNARDGWATANVFLSLIREMPQWAINNYLEKFPVTFGCHQAEMTGILINETRRRELEIQQEKIVSDIGRRIEIMTATPNFNTNSPVQVKALMAITGHSKHKSTDKITLKKIAFSDPFAGRIFNDILTVRKARKVLSTNLPASKFWNSRLLYRLNPDGTDTERLASSESSFWFGFNIQNIPTGVETAPVRDMFQADPGFHFGEGDYAQAEARDLAYISGDIKLIEAVDSGRDFHALNVERFFGLPYSSIFDDGTGKTLNKPIRDLSKRTNHGAGYNMQWSVLIDTMGLENIYKARDLLKLSRYWSARQIAQYLLDSYDKAYPDIRSDHGYYGWIKYQIRTTRMLVSALGWTRYCFGDPDKNKSDLNSYVAHPSQNLNAGTLNRAWKRVFTDVALREPRDFKLCAQIHDSIFFQYRIGREDLVWKVRECMLMDTPVTDRLGHSRKLRVPVDMKAGSDIWSKLVSWHPPENKEAA